MKIKVSFNLETEEVRKLINLDPNAESLEEIIQGIMHPAHIPFVVETKSKVS